MVVMFDFFVLFNLELIIRDFVYQVCWFFIIIDNKIVVIYYRELILYVYVFGGLKFVDCLNFVDCVGIFYKRFFNYSEFEI